MFTAVALGDIWSELFREKLREADNGNPEAQYDVGTMYQNGRGVEPDRDKAIVWFERAAAQGDAKAISRLKLMQANAARFDKTAVAAAGGDSESQYELGNMYLKGIGTNINPTKAISAFEQAARHGHIKATYKLGLMYYD
ncbi:MAG: tetratricopeptide repeat protein, partial [Thiohalobacterales bacterium]|nr:tetratricopeptide repeat protein [Thiohalobacterales bacterium]